MKTKKIHYVLIALFTMTLVSNMALAQSAVPHTSYGVWNRGADPSFDPSDPRFDYIVGVTSGPKWADIQPDNSTTFEWGQMQAAIDLAYGEDQLVALKINVGPQCPTWVYENGVPLVTTDTERFDSFPYYPDQDYIDFYYNMIDSFAAFIYSQPQAKQDIISFIFPQNGATGDEVPYKGTLLTESEMYDISDAQWTSFRINSWDHWKSAFRDDQLRPIPFLFNDVHPDSTEWTWIRDSIGDDFGIKNSNGYARGHHLTNEKVWYDQYHDSLVNPQGLALFNRAEMDQSWEDPMYDLNTELGFYWGALGGLSTGLSVWDITTSALEEAAVNTSVQETFRFFTKYAGQINPATSTKAFIALHEGLNSADTVKFPQHIYGDATRLNLARYDSICNAPLYANRGASMDDLARASKGQVAQRNEQTGYNDAGWEIWPTNYARFVTQMDPDAESIGLFRIGGDIDANSSIYSRFARSFENSTGRNAMYFQMHEDFFSASADTVKFSVTYYDKNAGSTWQLKYDAGAGNFKTAFTVTCDGSETWKTKDIIVTDAVMLHTGEQASDFALINNDALDDIFHMIEVEQSDGTFNDNVSITSPAGGALYYEGDVVSVTAEGFDFQDIQSINFSVGGVVSFVDNSAPYAHEYSNLPAGTHTLLAEMVDTNGDTLAAEEVVITVREIPAEDFVTITSPTDGQIFPSGSNITVKAEGYDDAGIEIMRFKVGTSGFVNKGIAPYSHTFTGLADGEHVFVVQMKGIDCVRLLSEEVTILIQDNCPDDVVLANDESTNEIYDARLTLTSSQLILSPAQVDYSASQEITLLPDFEVQLGAALQAFIDGCGE